MESYGIQEIAQKFTQYDMIQDHTELPDFPQHRTNLLEVYLKHGSVSYDSDLYELYTLVTSLVQMGLDTHDMVGVISDHSNQHATRSNQMKVLAGDYFSSRFYQLLANRGEVDMIHSLSAAICEANRLKMNLYLEMREMKLATEEIIGHSVEIKMQLFLPFTGCMKEAYAQKWSDLLRGFTRCEVIEEQLTLKKQPELHRMLEDQVADVTKQIQLLDSEPLIKELGGILESFVRRLSAPKVLEEI
jgi:heptaprenyl diphosphate synthase